MSLLRPTDFPTSTRILTACLALVVATSTGCGNAPDSLPASADTHAATATDSESLASTEPTEATQSEPAPTSSSEAVETSTSADTAASESQPANQPSQPQAATAAESAPQASPVDSTDSETAAAQQLERELAELVIPPAWLADITSQWDMSKPWKDARLEIRRLLGKGDDASRREGIKLMWDYKNKGDMGNGHEYGMYLFLGNEPLWAIAAFRERLADSALEYPPYFDLKGLASLYTDCGMFSEAEKLLLKGLDWAPPEPAWVEMRQAEMHDSLGDLYAASGRLDDARTHYQESVRLYPLGKPPYGKHLLPRRAKKVQSKLDLLSVRSLEGATLKDGTWQHAALGYSGDKDVTVSVEIKGGRITDVQIEHAEKIDQGATTIIPRRIIESQSLVVDGVSGATVTKDAIVTGTLEALRKAGLK